MNPMMPIIGRNSFNVLLHFFHSISSLLNLFPAVPNGAKHWLLGVDNTKGKEAASTFSITDFSKSKPLGLSRFLGF